MTNEPTSTCEYCGANRSPYAKVCHQCRRKLIPTRRRANHQYYNSRRIGAEPEGTDPGPSSNRGTTSGITYILVFATIGIIIGACTAAFYNTKPAPALLCPEYVWDMEESGTVTREEIYKGLDIYNCRWETQGEANENEGWQPTDYTPYIITAGLIGATIGALIRATIRWVTE